MKHIENMHVTKLRHEAPTTTTAISTTTTATTRRYVTKQRHETTSRNYVTKLRHETPTTTAATTATTMATKKRKNGMRSDAKVDHWSLLLRRWQSRRPHFKELESFLELVRLKEL